MHFCLLVHLYDFYSAKLLPAAGSLIFFLDLWFDSILLKVKFGCGVAGY